MRADFGYDPTRLSSLRTSTDAAVAALRSISSSDPSAQSAIDAAGRMVSVLENVWMPAIQAVRNSSALTSGTGYGFAGADAGDRPRGWWFRIADSGMCGSLEILFPGDDDISGEDIAAEIDDILGQQASGEQFSRLSILGRALSEIARDRELSADFLVAIGPDGLQDLYTRLFMLGAAYPHELRHPDRPWDQPRLIGTDLARTIGEPLNLVVSAGASRAEGRRVVSAAIAELSDARDAWEAAGLAGLVRVEGLPPSLAHEVFDAVSVLEHDTFARSFQDWNNTMYPELEWDYEELRLFAIANNPVLIHDLIHDHDRFVDGGDALLRELIESKGNYWRTEVDIAESLGKIFGHIIEFTPTSELVERRLDGGPAGTGVLFDLVDILLEADLKVTGLPVLAALGSFLPEIVGATPGSATPYTPQEVRAVLEDLFQDLSPAETDEALAIIVSSAIAQVPTTITSADFDGTEPAGIAVGDLLDALFGPAVGALDDVVDDKERQAAFWRSALDDAFGLIPLPGPSIAKTAIKQGVSAIIDGVVAGPDGHGAEVAAAQEALITNTVAALWADPTINAEVVEQALGDWDRTATLLGGDADDRRGGHELSDSEVERIRRALVRARNDGSRLDAEVFVKLPQIIDLVESLEDELTLSPERRRSD